MHTDLPLQLINHQLHSLIAAHPCIYMLTFLRWWSTVATLKNKNYIWSALGGGHTETKDVFTFFYPSSQTQTEIPGAGRVGYIAYNSQVISVHCESLFS